MQCWHMSGAGNDFMVIDGRGLTLDYSELALRLCKMVGCDGFMAVDNSDIADFKLHFYNSDGSRGEMCGNGSRCVSRFAYDHGIVGDVFTVETDAGILHAARLSEDMYRVQLNNPGVFDPERIPGVAYIELGAPGVPHAVEEIPGFRWEDKEKLLNHALELRHHKAFPKGANVNFYTWLDDSTLRVLTFERGVEGYTLACGTGCGSITSLLYYRGMLVDNRLTLMNEGGTLHFTVEGHDGIVDKLLMEGPAVIVKEYEV